MFATGSRGWGVRVLEHIPRGTFVAEYTGEVVRTEEARARMAEYDVQGLNYLICLREHTYAACACSCYILNMFVLFQP